MIKKFNVLQIQEFYDEIQIIHEALKLNSKIAERYISFSLNGKNSFFLNFQKDLNFFRNKEEPKFINFSVNFGKNDFEYLITADSFAKSYIVRVYQKGKMVHEQSFKELDKFNFVLNDTKLNFNFLSIYYYKLFNELLRNITVSNKVKSF